MMTRSDELSDPASDGASSRPRAEGNVSRTLSQHVLRDLLHPKERTRAPLVWVSAGITGLALFFVTVSLPYLLLLFAVVGFTIWFAKRLSFALFRGNAVEIGPDQFPDIHERILESRRRMGLEQRVAGFVSHDGELNAFFYRMSGRKVLVINSKMVEDMSPEELDFIVLRFVGYLRARQVDLGSIAAVVDILNAVPILGLLTRSYSRAAVLSGDRIGAHACKNMDTARSAMVKFAVGTDLQSRFSEAAYLRQAHDFRQTPWNFLARLWLEHPHLSDRMIELNSWIDGRQNRAPQKSE